MLLNLITQFTAHELWIEKGQSPDIDLAPWPQADKAALVEDEKLIIVQVNGKARAKMTIAADASKESIEASAKEQPNVQQFIEGKTIRKVIVVPGKLVNIVAN